MPIKNKLQLLRSVSRVAKSTCQLVLKYVFSQFRDLFSSSSNIPRIIRISEICMLTNQLPFRIFGTEFRLCSSKWRRLAQFTAFATNLLHVGIVLDWFRKNVLSFSSQPLENWRLVMVAYFLNAFSSGALAVFYVQTIRHEAIFYLMSCLKIEKRCQEQGLFTFKLP